MPYVSHMTCCSGFCVIDILQTWKRPGRFILCDGGHSELAGAWRGRSECMWRLTFGFREAHRHCEKAGVPLTAEAGGRNVLWSRMTADWPSSQAATDRRWRRPSGQCRAGTVKRCRPASAHAAQTRATQMPLIAVCSRHQNCLRGGIFAMCS